jgi:hypothetical protein
MTLRSKERLLESGIIHGHRRKTIAHPSRT